MLTYTGQRNLYGLLTSGTANTQNLVLGDSLMNAETRRLIAKSSGYLLQRTSTAAAVINQQFYELPNNLKKLRSVTTTLGTTTWPAYRSPSRRHWDYLNSSSGTAFTANHSQWWYPINRQVGFWPVPASASAVINYDYDIRHVDLSLADYTTGTIVTTTNGSTRIVGSSTSWTDPMVGRYLKIDKSNTNNNDGDGDFYEIKTVVSATAIDLVKPYQGASISSGAATYLIGEVSLLPDGFHELPVYRACEFYYSKNDEVRQAYFRGLASNLENELLGANDISDSVIVEDTDQRPENPNLYPQSIG